MIETKLNLRMRRLRDEIEVKLFQSNENRKIKYSCINTYAYNYLKPLSNETKSMSKP